MAESNAVYSYPEYDYDDYNYDDYDDYDNYNEYHYNDDYNENYQDNDDDYNNNYLEYNNDFHEEEITEPEPENEIIMTEQSVRDIQVGHSEGKSGSVLTIMVVSVLAAGLLGSVVYTLDRRNTVYNTVTSLNRELSLAEAENVRLQSELESKMSAKNVEDYAENVLGMRKMDTSQIKYIKIQTDDVVNIPEQEKGFFAKIKGFFQEFVEYFRG